MTVKKRVLAVLGPTASGKTSLGIALARAVGGEIISCDSMQIYRGLPVGTAQPTMQEREQSVHHLIGIVDVTENFSVSDYIALAAQKIDEITSRGKVPILVGGTGLYARALLRGYQFQDDSRNESLRKTLMQQAEQEGSHTLYARLQQLDPTATEKIHPNNVHRVVRALEYCLTTGEAFSQQAARTPENDSPYHSLMLVPFFQNREKLYKRVNQRVDVMLQDGLLDEAEMLYRHCEQTGHLLTAAQAIGYKEFFPYFRGECDLDTAVETLKRESRRYAKRQITWFTHEPDAVSLYLDTYADREAANQHAIALCSEFLAGKEMDE